ncbi:MAG TPA: MaoC family dehydratase [Gaiellaceae bacterium]|nr:MaoC family dehydratase [Gaiellaceae bacterium]
MGRGVIEAGQELGPSRWLEVTQERIDAFADATDDHQSIHVHPELAAQGPFGTTVAHGYLTLSLLIPLWNDVYRHHGIGINYGLNRLRFPAPVPSGSRIRARFRVEALDEIAGGVQATIAATVECDAQEKPVCVAELLLRLLR